MDKAFDVASILVVCEGNHCRSPMAAALLQAALGGTVAVASAGLEALEDLPAAPIARRLLAERGLDLSRHRGRRFTPALALAADLILVMDEGQKEACQRIAPSVRGRVFLLGHWRPSSARAVADPFQKGAERFQDTLQHISLCVADWLAHLIREKGIHEHHASHRSQNAPFQPGGPLRRTPW
jgi:protein-tyrosine phosphatase